MLHPRRPLLLHKHPLVQFPQTIDWVSALLVQADKPRLISIIIEVMLGVLSSMSSILIPMLEE